MKNTTAIINQKPISVELECPYCGEEISYAYNFFTEKHGEPTEWDYEKVRCPMCEKKFEIQGKEWS